MGRCAVAVTGAAGGVFRVERAIGQAVEGPALVSPVPFSARYDLDREAGTFSRVGHPLDGESVAGKILVCPGVKGGVAAGWTFLKLASLSVGFRGLVFGGVNPVMAQGAQAAGLAIAAGVDEAIFERVLSGARLRLEPESLRVLLLE